MFPHASRNHASKRSRGIARLSTATEKSILTYVAAASAAGVGVLALTQPSEAKVVFTSTHMVITGDRFLDLNHDGVSDFRFVHYGGVMRTGSFGSRQDLSINGQGANNQIVEAGSRGSIAALSSKISVGSSGKFIPNGFMEACLTISGATEVNNGKWINVKNKFLGLKFLIQGETHYGWARLTVMRSSRGCMISALLTGYAYETMANEPLLTGRQGTIDASDPMSSLPAQPPGTLGMLAQGTPGLSIWRREEESE